MPSGDMDFIVCTDEETEEYGSKLHACGLSGSPGLWGGGGEGGEHASSANSHMMELCTLSPRVTAASRTFYP